MRLTWGFAQDNTTFIPSFNAGPGANSNLIARLDQIYNSASSNTDLTQRPWFSLFDSVFQRWASISGLDFFYESNDDGAAFSNLNNSASRGLLGTRADIRIGGRPIDGNSGTLAFNFFPNVGEMVIDTNDTYYNTTTNNSLRLRNVVAHEIGHGIGMAHVFTSQTGINALMNPTINLTFDGPQYHDIIVAQRAYGDALEKGLGNDTAALSTSLGVIQDGGSVSIGNSARTFAVAPADTDFISIDDQSDIDFFSFTVNSAGSVSILLEALGFSYLTQPQGSNGQPTGSNVTFNTRERVDLNLSLFDTNGTSLLSFQNQTGLGGNEEINDFFLAQAGTYFIRVAGTNNPDSTTLDTQFYGLSVNFVAVIPEPNAFWLLLATSLWLGGRRRRTAGLTGCSI
jgi:serralysin